MRYTTIGYEGMYLVGAPRSDFQMDDLALYVRPAFPSELTHYYLTLWPEFGRCPTLIHPNESL